MVGSGGFISLDPHKWLYQPLDCGCLLYRRPRRRKGHFLTAATMPAALSAVPDRRLRILRGVSRVVAQVRALKLWLSLRYHGWRRSANRFEDWRQARRLAEAIRRSRTGIVAAPGTQRAVCFRHRGATQLSDEELNQVQSRGPDACHQPRPNLSLECFDATESSACVPAS